MSLATTLGRLFDRTVSAIMLGLGFALAASTAFVGV